MTATRPPGGRAPFSPDGTDPEDAEVEFDIAFTLNTGFLNQIINTQSRTDLLYIEYQPTWEELEQRWARRRPIPGTRAMSIRRSMARCSRCCTRVRRARRADDRDQHPAYARPLA